MIEQASQAMQDNQRSQARGLAVAVAILFALLALLAAPSVLSGCTGTKVAGSLSVSVDPSTCSESKAVDQTPRNDLAILDCARIGGEGTITVQFPREQWTAMRAGAEQRKRADAGAPPKAEPVGK